MDLMAWRFYLTLFQFKLFKSQGVSNPLLRLLSESKIRSFPTWTTVNDKCRFIFRLFHEWSDDMSDCENFLHFSSAMARCGGTGSAEAKITHIIWWHWWKKRQMDLNLSLTKEATGFYFQRAILGVDWINLIPCVYIWMSEFEWNLDCFDCQRNATHVL